MKSSTQTAKVAASQLTLADAIANFLRKPRSVGSRGACSIQRSSLGEVRLVSLSRRAVRLWCEQRLRRVKLSTVMVDLRVIRQSIELARRELGVKLDDNPAMGIELNEHDRRLSDDEVARLHEALEGWPLIQPMVIVAVETGLSRGAVSALQWRDVDLEQAILHVRHRADGPVVREVSLSPLAVETLRGVPHRGYRVFLVAVGQLEWMWTVVSRNAGLFGVKFWEPQHVLRREKAEEP